MPLLAERSLDLPRRTESPREVDAAPTRRPEIDALRVVAMLLVFTVHAAEPFNPWDPWHVQSPERSKWLGELVLFLAPWIMPLFMMLAGASAWHSLEKRTTPEYLNERVTRLIVPLTAGTLLLVPPQIYIDRRQRGLFDGSFLEFYPHFFEGIYPKGNFAWLHLWFLAVLGVFALLTLPLFRWLRHGAGRRAMATVARICRPPGALLLLVLPMVVLRVVLWGAFPHARPVITDWSNRMVLLPMFIYGYMLSGDPGLERAVDRQWKLMLAVGLVFSGAMFAWAWPGDLTQRFPIPFSADYVWFWSTYAIGGLVWPIAMIGAARAVNAGASRVLERARGLVNPFYILHQTVIVVLAFALLDDRAGAIASFFRLLIGAFATTVALSVLVERTPVTRVLFGVRTERSTHAGQCAPKP
jgi:glucans biosynthesis protein C